MTTAKHRIELRLRDLTQLFNVMDPSPFIERDLDHDAEEFIVSWARELPGRGDYELVIHLANLPEPERAAGVEDAVRHYFATRTGIKEREFRQLMRRGRTSLLIGIVFLAACLFLGGFAGKLGYRTASDVVKESLTIGGWVAMWRPLQIYLYDWWPLREEQQLYARLARVHVRLVLPK